MAVYEIALNIDLIFPIEETQMFGLTSVLTQDKNRLETLSVINALDHCKLRAFKPGLCTSHSQTLRLQSAPGIHLHKEVRSKEGLAESCMVP